MASITQEIIKHGPDNFTVRWSWLQEGPSGELLTRTGSRNTTELGAKRFAARHGLVKWEDRTKTPPRWERIPQELVA